MAESPVQLFERPCPLEYIAVADEVAYTALLRWLLGRDSPLPLDARVRFLSRLTGQHYDGASRTEALTEASTARGRIDLVVDVFATDKSWRVAIENKVKSIESPKFNHGLSRKR
jgi:hypothetical protein